MKKRLVDEFSKDAPVSVERGGDPETRKLTNARNMNQEKIAEDNSRTSAPQRREEMERE